MIVVKTFFWIFVSLVIYIYFGYPLLLFILSKLRPAPPTRQADITPTVSLIIPAYNEARVIAQKIDNALALDYPKDKLEIIVGSDGSTDCTNQIVAAYTDHQVRLVAFDTNRGKSSVQNEAAALATGEILVFSDASGMLQMDAIRKLVCHFADEQAGSVGGAVRDRTTTGTAVSEANDIYWRYEVFLRRTESRFGSLAMTSGSLFALRSSLFQPLPADVGDDFVLPLVTARLGYRTLYEPAAISADELSSKSSEKFRQKVRIVSKDLRGLLYQRKLLNPVCFPRYAFSLYSHKLLRWLVPFWLLGVFVTNVFVCGETPYTIFLSIQVLFYLCALLGALMYRLNGKSPLFYIPFYFCLLNLAAAKGVWDYLRDKRMGKWQTERGSAI